MKIVAVPGTVLWRRKAVLAMGVTQWMFREAVRRGRLKGRRFPWKKYALYTRRNVCRAFGLAPCDEAGRTANVEECRFVMMKESV